MKCCVHFAESPEKNEHCKHVVHFILMLSAMLSIGSLILDVVMVMVARRASKGLLAMLWMKRRAEGWFGIDAWFGVIHKNKRRNAPSSNNAIHPCLRLQISHALMVARLLR